MISLHQLFLDSLTPNYWGKEDVCIRKICQDSRKVGEHTLFCALEGTHVDGHNYIPTAIKNGATAILSEREPTVDNKDVTWVQVNNAREAMAWASARLHELPSSELKVCAVTGTNGKTTTAFLVHFLMNQAWHRAGLLSTIYADLGDPEQETEQTGFTTPEAPELQQLFARMKDNGCKGVSMEASSHALELQRTAGTFFDVGIFTNLSQDHLDFHKTEQAYFEAKSRLFETLISQSGGDVRNLGHPKKRPTAVINTDDRYGEKLVKLIDNRIRVITYGQNLHADIRILGFRMEKTGMQVQLKVANKEHLLKLPLLGRFNVLNAAAALGAAIGMGLNVRESVQWLSYAPQIPGRLELLDGGNPIRTFVDYAHTPDALANVTTALRELPHDRLITVFGCGGDRDKEKRPLMAEAAAKGSDFCVLTSDNPRNEKPEQILDEVERGMGGTPFLRITDRAEAIATAMKAAKPRDIVLIAGKGHEDYQEFQNGRRIQFSDQSVARRILRELEESRLEKSREWLKSDSPPRPNQR